MSNGQTAALGFFHGFSACACFSSHKLNSSHTAGQDEKLFCSSWHFISSKRDSWGEFVGFFGFIWLLLSNSMNITRSGNLYSMSFRTSPKIGMMFIPGNHNLFIPCFPKYQHEWLKSSPSPPCSIMAGTLLCQKFFNVLFFNGKWSIMFMHQHALARMSINMWL